MDCNLDFIKSTKIIMETKIVAKSLVQSLVGCSIEFRDGKNTDKLSGGPALNLLRKKIEKYCNKSFQSKSTLASISLACCQLYYLKQPNYFSVRSSITLRRYRKIVMELINSGSDSLEEKLCQCFEDKKIKADTDSRDLLIDAAKYFVGVYPSRLKNIKAYLTKDEIAYVL